MTFQEAKETSFKLKALKNGFSLTVSIKQNKEQNALKRNN